VVAGLGNIYVDEALHAASIRPTRRAHRVTQVEAKALHRSIKKILTRAIAARGTTFNDYRDAAGRQGGFKKQLKVYGREGMQCGKCRSVEVKKVKLNGRGTHYCPQCQK